MALAALIEIIYDTLLHPESWPAALDSISRAVGAIGACCLVRNNRTGRIESMSFGGPCAEMTADCLAYYAALAPYTPTISDASANDLVWLSDCLPEAALDNNEWFNDFAIKSGGGDILGGKLFEDTSHTVMFGIQFSVEKERFASANEDRLRQLMHPLRNAARLHVELRDLGWRCSAAAQALDQLSTAVMLVNRDGFVVELNKPAERIVELGDGLLIQNDRLVASRSFEQARLAAALASATAEGEVQAMEGYLLIGRREGRPDYVLTVAPLSARSSADGAPMALVLVVNPEWQVPSKEALVDLFGLSPAECRLAVALMRGRRMREIAGETGVEITTLRTQLSSILKKVAVERQADLVKAFSSIGFIDARSE